jgi:hypothetical protein
MTKIDPDTKRRQALANVYEFLLKLAESARRQPEDSIPNNKQESEAVSLKENIPP